MRCRCCNKRLDNRELTKKDRFGKYLETCSECMASIYENLVGIDDYEQSIRDIDKPFDTD